MTSDQKRNNNSQIQFLPTGVECNIACKYCYQNEERKVNEGITSKFNYEKILNVLNNDDRDLNLFGGEPLLAPINVIEDVLKLYKEKRNKVSMQTNLTLLNDKHIELFKKYKPHIGVSIDGWEDLNDARWIKDLETTRKYTEKTINNIKKCVDNNFSISTIITLHKVNVGTPERVRKFIEFITWLDSLKIRSSRLHLLEWDNPEFDDELNLTSKHKMQGHLFSDTISNSRMKIMDTINQRWKGKLKLGSEGVTKEWEMKAQFKSRNYTTNWNQLIIAH